jgi:hypothetical protein
MRAVSVLGWSILFLSGGTAAAQMPARPIGTVATPTLSPYLNLARPGPIAVNYYGLVRPQQDFTRSLQGLQGQVVVQQQTLNDLQSADAVVVPTGHQIYFLSYSNYFLTTGNRPMAGTVVQPMMPGMIGGVGTSRIGAGLMPSYGRGR